MSLTGTSPAPPQVSITQTSPDRTQLELNLTGFQADTLLIDGLPHVRLRLPGHWFSLDQGQPELPFISNRLILPAEGTPAAQLVQASWQEVPSLPVAPSKGSISRSVNPADVPWVFGDIYTSGGVAPAQVLELGRPFILRDYRGVSCKIHPFRWDADRGVLSVLTHAVIEVVTSGTGGVNAKSPRPQSGLDPQFDGLYRQGFDNYAASDKYSMVSTAGPMLIVCYDSYLSSVEPFVQWKLEKGQQAELITTSSLGGTDLEVQQGIIDAAVDRYYSAAGLTYLILVGDLPQVPSNTGLTEGALDDTRYGMVEGDDLYPDLFVSRISGGNSNDIAVQVQKIVLYERNPQPDGQWYHKAAGLASDEGSPPDTERADWLRDDLLSYNFTEVDQIYQPVGTTQDIEAAINDGRSLVNYIGHGSGYSWSNPYFHVTDVAALANSWMTPWIIDVSCSNGNFSLNQCFAEAWLRAGTVTQPQGAVGMYSASTTTEWVPPCVMQAETVDLLISEQAQVLGSLYYHGAMQVLDEYPGLDGRKLMEQYNIFGDCSLMVRTDTPLPLIVAHDEEIWLGAPMFNVETGVAGAVVALARDGQLYGVGVADATGSATVILDVPIITHGDVMLTVTGYNLQTYQTTISAIMPVDVTVEPDNVPLGATSQITVTLTDPAKIVADIAITISGYGIEDSTAVTGADGLAVFTVTPLYGEDLQLTGQIVGENYDIFSRNVVVTGASLLTDAQVVAEAAAVGLADSLAVNIPGTVTGSALAAGLTLELHGCGLDTFAVDEGSEVVVAVTPTGVGQVTAALFKTGYQVVEREITVVEAYGTLAGQVLDADAGGTPLAAAHVQLFPGGSGPVGLPLVDLVSDEAGLWAVPFELAADGYDLYVWKYGYSPQLETLSLLYGENNVSTGLELAPLGQFTGSVAAADDSTAVPAVIQVYRADTFEFLAEVFCDSLTGAYTIDPLPEFTYKLVASAGGYDAASVEVVLVAPGVEQDFLLPRIAASILIIDDDIFSKELALQPEKRDENGQLIAEAYPVADDRSAPDLANILTPMGYAVTSLPIPAYDAEQWSSYDLVIVACGDNINSLNDAIKAHLIEYVAQGGHLLMEGGELAYAHKDDTVFCQQVLHISDFTVDFGANILSAQSDHALLNWPHPISETLTFNYVGYGDSDVVVPLAPENQVAAWSLYPDQVSILCHDPNPAPEGGQIVYFAFDFANLDSPWQETLLQNTVIYLLTEEIGEAGISGSVKLHGGLDSAGVTVTLEPGGVALTTGPDGAYAFDELFAGVYQVTATKDGWTSGQVELELLATQQMTGVDFDLSQILLAEVCDSPALDIPDGEPITGVSCYLEVTERGNLTELAVYLDVTHPNLGDLVLELVSPAGTIVQLHQHGDEGVADLATWYPTLTSPFEPLTRLDGELIAGSWELHAVDTVAGDAGTINEWCLQLTYVADVSVAEGVPASVLALGGNFPNPFNPSTKIRYSLPGPGQVKLAVYDIRGRFVNVIVDAYLPGGNHEAVWQGEDSRGRAVASGTYFYNLTVGDRHLTGKMLLVK